MFLTNSILGDLISVFITLTILFIYYAKYKYQYWKKKNVPYIEPQIPFGNIGETIKGKTNIGVLVRRWYQEMKAQGHKHCGLYFLLAPTYMVIDLDLIKHILTKDFHHFNDRNIYYNEKDDPVGVSLAHIQGQRWKTLRAKLTPTFTSGKMKMMFQTLVDCEAGLRKKLEKESAKNKPIDIKEILACFTTEIIGSVAFGLDCKTFEDDDSPFRVFGRKMFEMPRSRKWKNQFASSFPNAARFFGITNTPKDVAEFFMQVVEETVNYRETNQVTRNDFMQLLIQLKNSPNGLTMNEVVAQTVTFFGGGFETSSTLMTFALYELARNPDIQQILREEINAVLKKHDGKITYDSVQEMKYLAQVIDETLRVHPPAQLTNRRCNLDYKVPGTDLVIKKGQSVIIPIVGIHFDEEYYPNPEKFDPDHFSDENNSKRPSYTHLPFGEGPRICIGMRFALMQSKVGLTSLISHFKFSVNKKTKEPLKMEPNNVLISAEGGVWLNAEKI